MFCCCSRVVSPVILGMYCCCGKVVIPVILGMHCSCRRMVSPVILWMYCCCRGVVSPVVLGMYCCCRRVFSLVILGMYWCRKRAVSPLVLADHPSGPRPMTRIQTANLQEPHHETTTTESTDNADSEPTSDHLHTFDSRSPLSSKQLIFTNEALCKSRGKLSYACHQLKNQGKINDTWTHDGRIRIRDNFKRIAKIESAAHLKKYE